MVGPRAVPNNVQTLKWKKLQNNYMIITTTNCVFKQQTAASLFALSFSHHRRHRHHCYINQHHLHCRCHNFPCTNAILINIFGYLGAIGHL